MPNSVVDVEELVKRWAWDMWEATKSKEQARFTRDSLQMDISWRRVTFTHKDPEYNDTNRPGAPRSKVLFKTFFSNDTNNQQAYSFKTERVTRSCCDVMIERGFTVGEEMSVKLACPWEVFEANAGFKRELTLTDSSAQTFEEELTWGVDSQIAVPPHTMTTAELVIGEDQYVGAFTVKSTFSGKVHVSITNLKDNNAFVKSMDGDIADIVRREVNNGLKDFVVEKDKVSFITRGNCKFNYAIEQHVKLKQDKIEAE